MTVDLADFIRDTLVGIVSGIKQAQASPEVGIHVPGGMIGGLKFPVESGVIHEARLVATTVKFDVAVTAERTADGGAKGAFRVGVVEASLGGAVGGRDERTSRIQFAVPLIIPRTDKTPP